MRLEVHYRDPLTGRHHVCGLTDLPNWAYSHALALYRLSLSSTEGGDPEEEEERQERYRECAEDALVRALQKFPAALPKLLAMNKVNTEGRSFLMDWPSVLPHFGGDDQAPGAGDTVEDRVTRASGEHLVQIFVKRCHKLWKEDDVVKLLYKCAERAVREHGENCFASDNDVGAGGKEEKNSDADSGAAVAPAPSSPLKCSFSPALARYAQCDPSEYDDAFRTFPPEAIALDPNIVAPAMAMGGFGGRRPRRWRPPRPQRRGGRGGDDGGGDPLEMLRQLLGAEGGGGEPLDPDSPLLQLYLRSLMPWAQVEGVRPPRG